MAKERFLTVLVPIKDGDCVNTTPYASKAALKTAVPLSMSNTNKIYKVSYTSGSATVVEYYRYIPNINNSDYTLVVDREFPYLGKPLEIFDFTYDATRMGQAPTISAQNVMWFAEKDASGNDVTLEAKWIEFGQQCHVTFNGENYYLKQIPTSSKSNEDARYKYDIDFISERAVLETVYLYDVVQPYITEKPISESAVFNFYGDVSELAKRVNASLIKSGLASLTRKYVAYPGHAGTEVPYLTYNQWNMVNVNPQQLVTDGVFANAGEIQVFRNLIYRKDYNAYLMEYIYVNDNGVYELTGYQCKLGNDQYGNPISSEEKLITFENNTIHEAIQRIFDEYKLQYYIVKEKGLDGQFTGNTKIWIADCQHDFADIEYTLLTSQPSDWATSYGSYYVRNANGTYSPNTSTTWAANTYYSKDFARDADGVPTTLNPLDYGVDNALMSKEKANTTDKIITRITGIGSTENIPWYYPNPTADGWIKPTLKTLGQEVSGATIDYPTSEGSTPAKSTRYEKYLKNRIGNNFQYGIVKELQNTDSYNKKPSFTTSRGTNQINGVHCEYLIKLRSYEVLTEQPDDWTTNYTHYYQYVDGVYTPLSNYVSFESEKYYKRILLYQNPKFTFEMTNPLVGNCTSFLAQRIQTGIVVESYDSSQTYPQETDFQKVCRKHDGEDYLMFDNDMVSFRLSLDFILSSVPFSKRYSDQGYLYPSKKLNSVDFFHDYADHTNREVHEYVLHGSGYIGEDFYKIPNLYPFVIWNEDIKWEGWYSVGGVNYKVMRHRIYGALDSGYSTIPNDWTGSHRVYPITRIKGEQYLDSSKIRQTTGGIDPYFLSSNIYKCNTSLTCNPYTGTHMSAYSRSPIMSASEWIDEHIDLKLRLYESDSWYLGDKAVQLADYGINGITKTGGYTPDIFDTIEFSRVKYITPQPNLMPEVYIKTDGERRFYNAHNYYVNGALLVGTADPMIGEVQSGSKVRNPLFKENENDADNKHYVFENEYMPNVPREHIEEFGDMKPTITEQKNYIPVSVTSTQFASIKTSLYYKNGSGVFVQCISSSIYSATTQYYAQLRIDVVDNFAYDTTDNDEVWENNDNGNISGEYKHPYFFARLRPLGFNIFDLALQDDMVLSMTTGHCGACNFNIAVDENTKKNTVQIWEHDVYTLSGDSYTKLYNQGELRRYVDETNLYYKIGSDYIGINDGLHIIEGGFLENSASTIRMYKRYTYSDEDVTDGLVGSAKDENVVHFEGDVMTSGRYIDVQQDTTENFVWIALTKDTDTYGTIMPAARPDYADGNFSVYIRPASIQDVHTSSSTFAQDDENADKFVFTNIKLPQVYLRRAERDLSRKLVAYMYDNNYQKFNFSVKFSRIFLAQNEQIDADLNENSVLYVSFNNKTYRQYVKHYSYRMTHDAVLPEITVDMNDTLPLSRTSIERQAAMQLKNNKWTIAQVQAASKKVKQSVESKTVGKNSTNIIGGNLVNKTNKTSFVSLGIASKQQSQQIETMRESMASDYYKREDFTIENGTDLNIGGEKFLPTAYNTQGVLRKRKWDYEKGKFVEDTTQKLAPAFINKIDKSLYDVHEEYQLLNSEPADFTINYANYYKLVSNVYTPLEEAETFAANTYYQRVEGATNLTIVPARVSGKQIVYGSSGVLKPLVMQSNVISERNYTLLSSQPSDWTTAWTNYYKKNTNGEYVQLTDASAPTFAQNTYYKEEATTYNFQATSDYTNIISAFDQLDIALHCAQVNIQSDGNGGYVAEFVYDLPDARQDPTSERPGECPVMDGDFWFRDVSVS